LFDPKHLAESITTIAGIEGLTVTGGEPLEQPLAVGRLCRMVREKGLSIMLFTGWEYEQMRHSNNQAVRQLLSQIDILVSGRFIKRLADKDLVWRGSSNQKMRFLTDRYSPSVLQNGHVQVEAVLKQGATNVLMTGFPDDSDIVVLSARLAAEAGIVLEPIERKCDENKILGDKNHAWIKNNC
jgi:anaerobic ribonucleoside-triphosphate reductase activating protein